MLSTLVIVALQDSRKVFSFLLTNWLRIPWFFSRGRTRLAFSFFLTYNFFFFPQAVILDTFISCSWRVFFCFFSGTVNAGRYYISKYIYIYIYIYYKAKVFGDPQKCLFLILKVLFLIKQVKHHNVFIYYTKYKSSSVSLTRYLEKLIWSLFSSLELKIIYPNYSGLFYKETSERETNQDQK